MNVHQNIQTAPTAQQQNVKKVSLEKVAIYSENSVA